MWACLLHPRRLWRCSSRDSTRILGKVGVLPNPHNPARWLLQAPAAASAWACYRAKGINRTIVRAEPLEPTLPLDRQPCHVTTTSIDYTLAMYAHVTHHPGTACTKVLVSRTLRKQYRSFG